MPQVPCIQQERVDTEFLPDDDSLPEMGLEMLHHMYDTCSGAELCKQVGGAGLDPFVSDMADLPMGALNRALVRGLSSVRSAHPQKKVQSGRARNVHVRGRLGNHASLIQDALLSSKKLCNQGQLKSSNQLQLLCAG